MPTTDQKELEKMYLDNTNIIYDFAQRHKDKYLCLFDTYEDMIQELSAKVWKVLPQYNKEYTLSTFINYVLTMYCKEIARSKYKQIMFDRNSIDTANQIVINNNPQTDEEDKTLINIRQDKSQDPCGELIAKEVEEKLSCYMKMKMDGKTIDEIAEVYGCSWRTMQRILQKEKNEIINQLTGE